MGFIVGFAGARNIYTSFLEGIHDPIARCLPEGVTYKQIAKVFIKYMDNHPEQLHLKADVTYGLAMREAFPYKEGES